MAHLFGDDLESFRYINALLRSLQATYSHQIRCFGQEMRTKD